MDLTNGQGELAALAFAAVWGIASILYGYLGRYIQPREVNLLTGTIAISLLSITLIVSSSHWESIPPVSIFSLFLSGVIAIGLGDTAFFFHG